MKYSFIKTIKRAFVLFLLLCFAQGAIAQGSSSNPILLLHSDSSFTATIVDSVIWYKFNALSHEIVVDINPYDFHSGTNAPTLGIYDDSLNLLNYCNDSTPIIYNNNLTLSNYYFIKITGLANDSFDVHLETQTIIVYDTNDFCPSIEACNLISNGSFTDVFPPATVIGSTSTNSLNENSFGTGQDSLHLVDTLENYYTNMVCQWNSISVTPQIFSDAIQTNYAHMWGGKVPGKPIKYEGIGTEVKIYPSIPYLIDYDLKTTNALPTGLIRIGFYPTLLVYLGYNPYNASGVLYFDDTIPNGITAWHHIKDTIILSTSLYGTSPMKQMFIYPYVQPTGGLVRLDIDNIVLRPLSPPPTNSYLSGVMHICRSNTDSIFQYKIINYDSLWPYTISVSKNSTSYSRRIFTDTFSVNIGYQSQTTITLEVCGKSSDFTVYRCCDPFSATDSAIYYCNDTINTPQIIDGENISICGWLQINADVTIKNSNILFGPKSGIRLGDGYQLIFDNDSLQKACDVLWEGVYASNSASSIIVKNSYITEAENAIVGSNNAEIYALNNNFINNFVGIWIRNYNPPSGLIDEGWVPPPPSNTYIAGNSFLNLSYVNYQLMNAGIRIDTVYNITIGDDSLSSLKNHFELLRYGIKATYADLRIINNEFKRIYRAKAKADVDNLIRPIEAAIHCTKPIAKNSQSLPPPILFTSCISPKLVLGNNTNSINSFDSCNFGIFSYGFEMDVRNTSFNNQYYSAIFVLEPKNNSLINNNTISMSSQFISKDTNIIHAAISVRKVFNSFIGIDLDIIGNTINNTRTGISLLNTSSSANNGARWVRVGSNMIHFDHMDNALSYKGIKIQGCDRILVAGNSIDVVGNATHYTDPEKVQGIHMAQCMGTWIADNKDITDCGAGIYVVGNCHLSQFACNDFVYCGNGIYFKPNSTQNGISATIISQQGYSQRASDNFWTATHNEQRIAGGLNSQNQVDWYYRGTNDLVNNKFYIGTIPYTLTSNIYPILNTNVLTQCVGIPDPNPNPDDWAYAMQQREERFGEIVRAEVSYEILEDEFEDYDEDYLFEMLYANPELMNLGETDDTAYINFYNYRTDSTIADFVTIQELIDSGNVNQALQENGILTAQTLIETNKKVTNDIYLNTWAQNIEIDSIQRQTLFSIALLTPYIGGEGVYSARAMLGIDPEDYNLPYRLGHFTDTLLVEEENNINVFPNPTNSNITIEFNKEFDNAEFILFDIIGKELLYQNINGTEVKIDLSKLNPGIYFYSIKGNSFETITGKIIKQ